MHVKKASLESPAFQSLASLCLAAKLLGIESHPNTLCRDAGLTLTSALDLSDMLTACRELRLKAQYSKVTADELSSNALFPALVRLSGHWILIVKVGEHGALLQNPGNAENPNPFIQQIDHFNAQWDGNLLLMKPKDRPRNAKFDISWFYPSIYKHRRLLGEVLILSFVLQIIGLLTPLMFQVITDKVLVNNALATLDVIAIGLGVAYVFEFALSWVRTYLFSHTTSRIDIVLGANLFRHMMALPLSYYEKRQVGDSIARARELENLRQFLTGNALTLVLDLLFSVVFIAIMLSYSATLSVITLGCIPLFFTISFILVPIFRRRLEVQFTENAKSQSLLVECVNGIATIKSSSLSAIFQRRWSSQLARYVAAGLRANNIGTIAQESISLVSKVAMLATLWYGTHLVMSGDLSLGMFLAFNMLAQRTVQPVVRIAQMWNDFQQASMSIEKLADILDTIPEASSTNRTAHRVQGEIEFRDVSFRYSPIGKLILTGIHLHLKCGETVGIVGRSGSGKSTLAKLTQRLYCVDDGNILIDGVDLNTVNIEHLRSQIGVVLQESFLFDGSIKDNIAVGSPGVSFEKIIHCAKMAGAHEFICEMNEGYDSPVGEKGVGLSGGQRQRIAIARALINDPKILIFDEATSALDYESESIIHRNMQAICAGRTVLIIAHRLSAVRNADRIIVMDKGRVLEQGTHETLLDIPGGSYASLWGMQYGDLHHEAPVTK